MKKIILFSTFCIICFNDIIAQNTAGKAIPIVYTYSFKNISYCDFYEFKIYKDSIVNNDALENLKKEYINSTFFNSENSANNFLKVKCILSFKWGIEDIVCINYDKVYNDGKKENMNFISHKSLTILKNIEEVLKLPNDAFWEFYNSKDNLDYPEINKLKPLVQGSKGILNIEKLGEVLKKNKSTLAKYLDD